MQRKKATQQTKIDPRVKDVLLLLGTGAFLAASILIPGLPIVVKPFLDEKRKREADEWKRFNTWRLRQVLKRMREQKLVEIVEENGIQIVKVAENGRRRLLKFDLEKMTIENKKWDGKWRIIIYDIFTGKKQERELFRRTLQKMKFYRLQKSVYLTPFPCKDEIEYLRQVCNVGNEVLILTVSGIENEHAYKEYFGFI